MCFKKSLTTTVYRKGGCRVDISHNLSTVIIGEKINPTGKKEFARELVCGNLSRVRKLASQQATAGAHIIDVNVGAEGIDEVTLLPRAVAAAMEVVDLPISIDTANAEAMDAAFSVFEGKAILNSITGEEKALERFLPIVKKYRCAFIALCYDDDGIDSDPQKRLRVAKKIIARAGQVGIPPEDIIIDPLAMPIATQFNAAMQTFETIELVRAECDNNITLGVSNVSFGLPDRQSLNNTILALAIWMGVNCPIVDPTSVSLRETIMASDLILGKDEFAARWIDTYRKRMTTKKN